jgi:hypothetical protein
LEKQYKDKIKIVNDDEKIILGPFHFLLEKHSINYVYDMLGISDKHFKIDDNIPRIFISYYFVNIRENFLFRLNLERSN